jgi:hypothetical protein
VLLLEEGLECRKRCFLELNSGNQQSSLHRNLMFADLFSILGLDSKFSQLRENFAVCGVKLDWQ